MTSGKEIYKRIESKIKTLESESRDLATKINDEQTTIQKLSNEQGGFYERLANIYLPEMEASAVKSTLKEVRGDVQRIFDRKNERRRELEKLMSESDERRNNLQERLEKTNDELDKIEDEREATEEKINNELTNDIAYQSLKKNADEAQERLNQNKKRVEVFDSEAKGKLEAYESNKLFMYLIEKGYGDGKYRANNLIKSLDSSVARVVKFAKNRENYEFLKAMPELMKEEVAKQQSELDNLIEKMDSVEEAAAKKYGLPGIVEDGETLGRNRNDLSEEIEQVNSLYTKYSHEIKEVDDSKGKYHGEAIQKMRGFLTGESIEELRKRARETPNQEDDGIVDKIEENEREIEQDKIKISNLMNDQQKLIEKIRELKKVSTVFTSNDYDSSRSIFNEGFDINDLLTGYLIGRYTSRDITKKISDNQRFKPKPAPSSYGGGYTSSRSGSRGGFGGFGGGGRSTGGGFGGGGRRTGGGF